MEGNNSGRLAALQELKRIKQRGEKKKYEPEAAYQPVYDIVDEDEYSERVKKRQEDSDWIVEDPLAHGSGYLEDGREIFDDEYSDDEADKEGKSKKKAKDGKFKSTNPNVRQSDGEGSKNKQNLKSFFSGTSAKKTESISNANDEELLQEVLQSHFASNSTVNHKREPVSNNKSNVAAQISKFTGTFAPKLDSSDHFVPTNPFSIKQSQPNKRMAAASLSKECSPTKIPPQKAPKQSSPSPVEDSKVGPVPKIQKQLFTSIKRDDKSTTGSRNSEATSGVEKNLDSGPETNQDFIGLEANQNLGLETNQDFNGVEKVSFSPKNPEISSRDDASSNEPERECVGTVPENFGTEPVNADAASKLKFYLLDAYEDQTKNPGTVYLFGRTYDYRKRAYCSCSVIIKNIERRLFILPRERRINLRTGESYGEMLQMSEVYEEVKRHTDKLNVPRTRSRTVTRKYGIIGSLRVDAPFEAEYLEIRYGFNFLPLAADSTGETFGAVFGSTSSALELFLLERNIKGPRWLDITDAVKLETSPTWCPAYSVSRTNQISPTAETSAPPLSIAALRLKTMPNKRNQHEILCASLWTRASWEVEKDLLDNSWQHCCIVAKSAESAFPLDFKDKLQNQAITTIEVVGNERALLNLLLTKLQKSDPDIIFGHDLWNFELEIIIQRMTVHKIPLWSRLGRLRRTNALKHPPHQKSALLDVTAGRLLCDVGIMARELIKSKDYDLPGLAEQILAVEKPVEILPESVKFVFNSSNDLLFFIANVKSECGYILGIANKLKCLPLAAEITRIVGGVLSKTLMGGRSERTDYLLLHALESAGYIYPDKHQHRKKGAKADVSVLVKDENEEENENIAANQSAGKKAAYAGGLVLEPKKGLYDQMVLLLDFNSLYPSIIQEFNICFTTINLLPYVVDSAETKQDILPNIPDPSLELGILPVEIRKLVESRRAIKSLMKDTGISAEQRQQYSIRQQALKLTANSMYGCLGFGSSRFYAKPLAALITSKGREILLDTKELVESMGLEVIYGDTDSIMIHTNRLDMDEVLNLAKKVKTEVNKKYTQLELEVDGVFKKLLLLKKKKYAGLLVERQIGSKFSYVKQVKGLDIVRRDWSLISVESGDAVLNEILSEKGVDEILENIHQFLTDVGNEIRADAISKEKYVIKKQLTKAPNDYGDKKSLPHVIVALRLNDKGRTFKQGDVVSYVICEDGTNNSAVQRAYDLSELDENETLKIDANYYLSQQIHPVVARLCEPIDGTDGVRIAECLGLDATPYRRRLLAEGSAGNAEADYDWSSLFAPSSDSLCASFEFSCPECKATCEIRGALVGKGSDINFSLASCQTATCRFSPLFNWHLLSNRLTLLLRRLIDKYYANWMICEDITCAYKTRRVSFSIEQGHVKCPVCRKNVLKQEMTEKALFDQLSFFQRIFDLNSALSQANKEEIDSLKSNLKEALEAYNQLNAVVQHFLNHNAFSQVDLGKLFQSLTFLRY